MTRLKIIIGLAVAAVLASTTLGGGPAFAAPDMEYNVAGSDSTALCAEIVGQVNVAAACVSFLPDGDYFYVRDTLSDGRSGAVDWENYNSAGSLVRQGVCAQTAGVTKAGYCNKNFTEGTQIRYRACAMEWSTKDLFQCGGWYWRAV
ncbi:hypothetical protein [Actinoplanes sp. NPDC051494]|uniref:hypothetical protein n=1 Tax=Actinoplanes sp. NPDC051494 TaxID=3363907 RepID=UPI0037A78067